MLTVEVKLNGELVAHAGLLNVSDLADLSDYEVHWAESSCPELGIEGAGGTFTITAHRRRQTAWALVAKAVAGILDRLALGPGDGTR